MGEKYTTESNRLKAKGINLEYIEKEFTKLNQHVENRKGYIMLPSLNGFEFHEIDEINLQEYLAFERLRKKIEILRS